MHDIFVTDLRHFLDEDGQVPDLPQPAVALATFLGAVAAWVTNGGTEAPRPTNVLCRWRKARGTCPGMIDAMFVPDEEAIVWACPECDAEGTIYGWSGTSWDRGPTA